MKKLSNTTKRGAMIVLFFTLLIGTANAQNFDKGDLAHIEAGAAIHSATYFGVSALKWDDKWKYIMPAITVNVVGAGKEIIDSNEPNNYFSMKDMMLNNVGMLISMGLIEGLKAVGVPENIAVSSVLSVSTLSLGLTVNF